MNPSVNHSGTPNQAHDTHPFALFPLGPVAFFSRRTCDLLRRPWLRHAEVGLSAHLSIRYHFIASWLVQKQSVSVRLFLRTRLLSPQRPMGRAGPNRVMHFSEVPTTLPADASRPVPRAELYLLAVQGHTPRVRPRDRWESPHHLSPLMIKRESPSMHVLKHTCGTMRSLRHRP